MHSGVFKGKEASCPEFTLKWKREVGKKARENGKENKAKMQTNGSKLVGAPCTVLIIILQN